MPYPVSENANGVIGGVSQNEAEVRAVVEEILVEGTENEVNWLMELVHATEVGGSVNIGDEEYVHRIITAAKGNQRKVAFECARERICADYGIVSTVEA